MAIDNLDFSRYQLGWSDDQIPVFKPKKGINEAIVREMSGIKNEEKWMLDFRLNALKKFEKQPMVPWFADRMPISISTISTTTSSPRRIRLTLEDLPTTSRTPTSDWASPRPNASTWRRHGAVESEVSFTAIARLRASRRPLLRYGHRDSWYPISCASTSARVIPPTTTSSPRLTSAVWSGGSFIYVPPASMSTSRCRPTFDHHREHGPVRAHADHRGRRVPGHYVEGCSRPVYSTDSLHSAVVETRRSSGRTDHVHDDSELVEQRLNSSPSAPAPRPRPTSSGLTATLVRD